MGIRENMGEYLKCYMERENKTLEELSEQLQVARLSLQKYIKGEGNPSVETIEHIAKRTGTDVFEIIGSGINRGGDEAEDMERLIEGCREVMVLMLAMLFAVREIFEENMS